jgi:hypothetical protein
MVRQKYLDVSKHAIDLLVWMHRQAEKHMVASLRGLAAKSASVEHDICALPWR